MVRIVTKVFKSSGPPKQLGPGINLQLIDLRGKGERRELQIVSIENGSTDCYAHLDCR